MRAQYTKRPIGSLDVLSRALDIELGVLINTANTIDRHYHPYQIPKKKGGFRTIHIPTSHLKSIQKRINSRILGNVIYPHYLFGGIKEKDYVKNAAQHTGCKALIALDVKDFYPSISINAVKDIFQYFFKFPKDVADILAKLCCLNGHVPQGACTSSHLANLSLHDSEYHFAQYCTNRGWTYTRLLDDISVSSKAIFPQKDVDSIISKAKSMLSAAGLKLNNKKTKILSKANPVALMEVTGLWLNRGKPRAHRADRNTIRQEVHQCEILANEGREKKKYHDFHGHVSGRVSKLAYLEHVNAKDYRDRLRAVLPVYDVNQATNLLKQAEYMSRTAKNNRASVSYYKKYHVLKHRLNILTRTDRAFARRIQSILSTCKPTLRSGDLL
ncbi:reverse transcriptase family protein [Achromobacter xylosoxidans]|uniref:reverse transcriptase family protein n=1 Tax=Alcaligenes xylosoxydans xylosoxydans TaxID=85698 RepID=UPI00336A36DA